MTAFTVFGVPGLGEIEGGDDLADLIDAATELRDGDIVVVSSKVVSKAEGRVIAAEDREQAIEGETLRVVATKEHSGGVLRVVENRTGVVAAAAGVDASNTPEGTVLLLPVDPDASARTLCEKLRKATGGQIGVIISDTVGRPWRIGQTNIAIGAAGVQVLDDLRGTVDRNGKPLDVTMPCVADEIAGAAELVQGKAAGIPVAIVRGLARVVTESDISAGAISAGARSIVRPAEEDLFRLGTAEAYRLGYNDAIASQPLNGTATENSELQKTQW